jgi:hypothetical protein
MRAMASAHDSDVTALPLRRGFRALRMTNSSHDFDDAESMDYRQGNCAAFAARATRMLGVVRITEDEKIG